MKKALSLLGILLCFQSFSQDTLPLKFHGFGFTIMYEGTHHDKNHETPYAENYRFQRVDSVLMGGGFFYANERIRGSWHYQFQVKASFWVNNFYGILSELNPEGKLMSQSSMEFKDVSFYSQLSFGAGYRLLENRKRVLLIPYFQVNPGLFLGRWVIRKKGYGYDLDLYDLILLNNVEYSGMALVALFLQPAIGLDFRVAIDHRSYFRFGVDYHAQHFSRSTFGNVKRNTHGPGAFAGFLYEL